MIEYQLKDVDGNTYNLNSDAVTVDLKNTWSQGLDNFEVENEIIENSFLPGAQIIGASRLMSRELEMSVTSTAPDSSDYRAQINELMEFLHRTHYIVDVTNDMQIEVAISATGLSYGQGGFKKFSENMFTFLALSPYWEALTLTTVTGTVLADTITAVDTDNEGFLPSSAVITLETTAAVNNIEMFVGSTQEGIQIEDNLFGTTGNLTIVIDSGAGLVSIGDMNRNSSIAEGTGFFYIQVGEDTLSILVADEDVDYTIEFAKRYYV